MPAKERDEEKEASQGYIYYGIKRHIFIWIVAIHYAELSRNQRKFHQIPAQILM